MHTRMHARALCTQRTYTSMIIMQYIRTAIHINNFDLFICFILISKTQLSAEDIFIVIHVHVRVQDTHKHAHEHRQLSQSVYFSCICALFAQ